MTNEPIVRVTRILIFQGPQSWIEQTMAKSWLQPGQRIDMPNGTANAWAEETQRTTINPVTVKE